MIRIVADERERPSGVPTELVSLGATVDYRLLEVGDYLAGSYAVERKSVRDFFSSLYDGRLFDQAFRLGASYENRILVVEGSFDEGLKHLKNPRSLWGALISAVLDFKLNLFFTPDPRQTAQFILTLAKGGRYKGGRSGPTVVVRKPKSNDARKVQLLIISSLPGIGPRLADQLLANLGSVRKVFTASTTEMALEAGIGRERALRLTRLLDFPYKHSKTSSSQARLRE